MRLRTKLGASLATVAIAVGTAGIAIGVSGAADAATGASDGTWGPVQDIPGLAALDSTPAGTNPARVNAVGCSSLGNCVAVGYYAPTTGTVDGVPFVVTEVDGTWGNAQPVAGLPALGTDTTSTLTQVSCGASDFCTAAGTYYDADGAPHYFVITETGGTWGTPTVLDASGLGSVVSLNVNSLSCPETGECTIIGSYTPTGTAANPAPFTVDESAGTWGGMQPLAGVSSLPSSAPIQMSGLDSLSCGAPGDCTAGGSYEYGTAQLPFIVSESGHSWGEPQPIPGLSALSSGGQGTAYPGNEVTSVSCPDASDCAVVGTYFPELNAAGLAFTLDEAGGVWGQAKALSIPSGDTLNTQPTFYVSCRSAGNCVTAGTAEVNPATASSEVVTATESSSGAWGAATAIPGMSADDEPYAVGLVCVPAGDCTVLGVDAPGGQAPFEIFSATSADGGTMGAAQEVAPTGNDQPTLPQLACPQNGNCTVTYDYDSSLPQMVTEATASTVTLTASAPKVTYGAEQSATLKATVSSPAGGMPTGTVTVTGPSGSTPCTITLTSGTGTCTLTAEQLPAGTDTLTATYGGDATYWPANGKTTITVGPAGTVTRLAFTPGSIAFTGAATTLAVSGSVSSTAGTPNGSVTVRVDGKAVSGCINVSFSGTVSCKGTTAILAGGKHLVTLAYSGLDDFAASTSASLPLTVAKRGTTTTLTLAKTSVTYGHESAGKFTASVGRVGTVYPTGKVAVRIGGTTVCTITLSKGVGGCTLANTRLRSGTYTFVALYSGDSNYNQSESAKKTLKVAA
jgi:hypothetical protein